MPGHGLEIEKQYILTDSFLSEVIVIPSISELSSINQNQLPIDNPYFSKLIYQDIISYDKDEAGIKSISRVRHELSRSGEERYLLSFKHGSSQDMFEKEILICKEEFNILLKTKQTSLLHLEKLRYLYPIEKSNNILEIDIFTQGLAGMHVGEIEFGSLEDMYSFHNPSYIEKDITDIGLFSRETIHFFSEKNCIDYTQFIK